MDYEAGGGPWRVVRWPRLTRWLKAHPFLTKIAAYACMFFVCMGLSTLPLPIPLILLTLLLALFATGVGYCIWRPSGDGAAFFIVFFVGLPLVIFGILCIILEWAVYLSPVS